MLNEFVVHFNLETSSVDVEDTRATHCKSRVPLNYSLLELVDRSLFWIDSTIKVIGRLTVVG